MCRRKAYVEAPRQDIAPLLFAAAAVMFLLDTLATVLLGGGFRRAATVAASLLVLSLAPLSSPPALAQSEAEKQISDADLKAALQTHLAYVKTGDSELDDTSEAGLRGLTLLMTDRTSASLGEPVALDLAQDDLTFYPIIYWPVPDTVEPLPDAVRSQTRSLYEKWWHVVF